MVVFLAIK